MRILYNSLEVPHVLNTKLGELIYNKHDKVLYTKDKYMNILKIATGGSGNGKDGKDGKDGRDGVSFNIQGTDTYANIIAKPNPKKGDMWIASDRAGHGIVYNGLKWTDVGQITGDKGDKGDPGKTGAQGKTGTDGKSAYAVWLAQGNTGTIQDFFKALEGQQGVQGQKGIQGTGIHFERAYATKADMIAANPNPEIGETHLITGTGDMWTWDNPNPPHDPAGAIWNDIGHVQGAQGNAGVQGIQGVPGHDGQPGKDGKDGDPLQLATSAETIAGTVSDKANTPQGTRAAYVPKTGGEYTGGITAPTMQVHTYVKGLKGTVNDWILGRPSAQQPYFYLAGYTSHNTIRMMDNGDIDLKPKAGRHAQINGETILTPINGIECTNGSAIFKSTNPSDGMQLIRYFTGTKETFRIGRRSTAERQVKFYNMLGSNLVSLADSGDIELRTKSGRHAKVNGKNILTGKLTGTTLHLDF